MSKRLNKYGIYFIIICDIENESLDGKEGLIRRKEKHVFLRYEIPEPSG